MASGHTLGALQPDGRRVAEPTFDPVHVAQMVVHLSGLPNSVTVLDVNIMYVFLFLFFEIRWFTDPSPFFHCTFLHPGRLGYLMQDADEGWFDNAK